MKFVYVSFISLLLLGCVPTTPVPVTVTPSPIGPQPPTETVTPAPGNDPVFVGAGDIADCNGNGDEATANLLDNIPGTVFTIGDNAYPDGAASDFVNCYDPSWGRHKARTFPVPGNHDYIMAGANAYFDYFGAVAGDRDKGYYSYDLGTWHIIALNSNLPVGVGSAQEQWLRADLAAHQVDCTLAYWHHPLFSSSSVHGSNAGMLPLWQALYDYGADVVLAGHDHTYERFAPQDPLGLADPLRGIREFVVGSGGRSHYGFGIPRPNSEVRNNDTYGVLKLTLHPDSYSWEFIPEEGKTFTDSGSAPCVTTATAASSGVLTFIPTDDATLRSNSPDTNYGPDSTLQADNDPPDNFLIQFNISGLNNRLVLNASLHLYNVNKSDAGGDLYHIADQNWDEKTVTWNAAPLAGSTPLASLGPVEKDSWYEIDVTSVIMGDGIYSFRMATTSDDGADYASKEAGVEFSPRLVISVGEP